MRKNILLFIRLKSNICIDYSFSYKGESTVFFQELAMDNLSANSLIAFPEFPNTFDKMVIDKDKIYLKVFYTKYKNQN